MSKNKKCNTQKVIQEVKINVPDFVKPPNPPTPESYERIQIALPTPPGVSQLPPFIYFDVDNRFTNAQKTRIRSTIISLIGSWNQHYVETAADGTSDWAACSLKYAKKKLRPVWLRKDVKIPNGEVALEFAMDELTQLFADNGNKKSPIAYIKYQNTSEQTTIFGRDASKQFNVPLTVRVNSRALDDPGLTLLLLSGSLFHAWLHRAGYRHPEGEYTSYLIGEAPMCLMRGFQDKVPGQPDSLLTQYFD